MGLASEIDLLVEFEAFKAAPFFVTSSDPFHIVANPNIPHLVDCFLDEQKCFDFDKFVAIYLKAIESVVNIIFATQKNPRRLNIITTNEQFLAMTCKDCSTMSTEEGRPCQCAKCAVVVSRTKIGACLQFEWKHSGISAYCSMDIVPKFNIQPTPAMELAFIINTGMASLKNKTIWQNHLHSYVETDMIIQDINDSDKVIPVDAVILKQIILKGKHGG